MPYCHMVTYKNVEPLEECRRLHVMKSTFTISKRRHRLYTISGLFENFFSISGQLFACQNDYIFTDIRERPYYEFCLSKNRI